MNPERQPTECWTVYGGGVAATVFALPGPHDFTGLEPMLPNASYRRFAPQDWADE
jgi:hypothetical protein